MRVLGLLFGREEALRRLLPTHEVAFQVLAGQNVEVNDFLRWPLLRVMDELLTRGIDTIFFEQLRNGRPAPDYHRSTESGVVLVLPGGKASLEFARLVAEESQASRPLSLDELLLLNHLWLDRRLTTADAASLVQKPEAEARGRLQRLVESGLAESCGERKGRSWHLSAATYRRLGERAAYVRQPGFEPLQQEQMVLQYVEKHGKITRREVAELCRLSPDHAKRVLARLVDRGELSQHGQRKGASYGSPPKDMGGSKSNMGAPKTAPKSRARRGSE